MWNVKTKVMPVIIGATGTIQKIREQHTRKTRSQGTTENRHIGHSNILRKVKLKVKQPRYRPGVAQSVPGI